MHIVCHAFVSHSGGGGGHISRILIVSGLSVCWTVGVSGYSISL